MVRLLYTVGNDKRGKGGGVSKTLSVVSSASAAALNNSLWTLVGRGGGGGRGSITIDVCGYVTVRDAWVCMCVCV